MINLNDNGKINIYDSFYFLRHILLIFSSIVLGYTISDLDPRIHNFFTTYYGQFLAIFIFLISGLIKIKNNNKLILQIFIMLIFSVICVYILQKIKNKNKNKKE